ncbi:jg25277, partial [Pararge aegeria aegeria]
MPAECLPCKKLSRTTVSANLPKRPIFLLQATLLIPSVSVNPTLEEIQDVLVLAGKQISGLSKGVAQWTGGKPPK